MRFAPESGKLVHERVAGKPHVEPRALEQRRFEREKGDELVERRGDLRDAVPAPGPDLRADPVDRGDAERLGVAREPEVEAGVVYGHERVRPFAFELPLQVPQEPGEEPAPLGDFPEPDDARLRNVRAQPRALRREGVAADAGDFDGPRREDAPDLAHERRRVEVAGDFPRADRQPDRRLHGARPFPRRGAGGSARSRSSPSGGRLRRAARG